MSLKQKTKDLGYNSDDLAERWKRTDGKPLTRRRVNQILKNPNQMHIDAVAGLPTKPGNTRGGFTT